MGEIVAPDVIIVLFIAVILFLIWCVVLFVRSRKI